MIKKLKIKNYNIYSNIKHHIIRNHVCSKRVKHVIKNINTLKHIYYMIVNDYVHYLSYLSTFYSSYLGYLLFFVILPDFISALCVSLLTVNNSINLSLPCI